MTSAAAAAALVLLAGGAAPAQEVTMPADFVITAPAIVTLDPSRPRAAAVAVRAGRIVAVGTAEEMKPHLGRGTRRIDLKEGAIVPGLGDAHVHVEGIGDALENIDLVGAATLEDAVARVRAGRRRRCRRGTGCAAGAGTRTTGRRRPFPPPPPSTPPPATGPAFLRRDRRARGVGEHAGAGAGRHHRGDRRTRAGGRIIRDADGRPSGVLVDAAMELVSAKIPAPSREARKRRIAKGLRACGGGRPHLRPRRGRGPRRRWPSTRSCSPRARCPCAPT